MISISLFPILRPNLRFSMIQFLLSLSLSLNDQNNFTFKDLVEIISTSSTGGNDIGRAGEIIPATHVPAETSCRILVRTQQALSRHTWDQTSCRAHRYANPNDSSLLPRIEIHRTRQENIFPSRVALFKVPRHDARVFPTCFGASERE